VNAADIQNGTIRDRFDATTKAVLAADEAHLRQALERLSWTRRGVLQRLSR
jgi:hypothetical protein